MAAYFRRICFAVVLCGSIHAAEWSYTGEHGIDHWKDNFATCSGERQSPVDLRNWQFDSSISNLTMKNFDHAAEEVQWEFENNGHSATWYITDSVLTTSGGGLPGSYKAAQFHFHWGSADSKGSEHTLEGHAYPLEMHIVHFNAKFPTLETAVQDENGLAVLGVFFEIASEDNSKLDRIINALEEIIEPTTGVRQTMAGFPLYELMPADRTNYFRYSGGLTTPPCAEVVIWTVFEEPVKISANQLAHFRQLRDTHGDKVQDNFRPTQPLHGREITASFISSANSYARVHLAVTSVIFYYCFCLL